MAQFTKPDKSFAPESANQVPTDLDTLFEQAGLVRSLRGKSGGVTRRMRFARASQQELTSPAPVPRRSSNGAEWLAVSAWEKENWLWHGFSTRRGGQSLAYCPEGAPGDLNLGFTADDDPETVIWNRRLLAEAISGSRETPLVTLHQIHSKHVVRLRTAGQKFEGSGRIFSPAGEKGDGLMTDEPGLLLAIQTADCIPVLVADRRRHVVAAFHAGWRGTVNRIVESGIGRLRLEFGSRPEDMTAAIGPGIAACCYAVGEEVFSAFESQFDYAQELFLEVYDSDPVRDRYPMLFLTQRAPGHSPIGPSLHLNLIEANRRQLLAAGLKPRSIQSISACTSCHHELFFSHRASQGRAGRMMSLIGIRPPARQERRDKGT
ncbi:MAG: peptidoglycan editing factor PgeF [Terracidiphilus sp.]